MRTRKHTALFALVHALAALGCTDAAPLPCLASADCGAHAACVVDEHGSHCASPSSSSPTTRGSVALTPIAARSGALTLRGSLATTAGRSR